MGSAQLTGFLRHLHSLTNPEGSSEPSDADLLGRFVARRDEAAFTLLVRRHGPMVLGVCRRLLGNEHDVEDAFQATFLTLARKAGSISNRASLGAGCTPSPAERLPAQGRRQPSAAGTSRPPVKLDRKTSSRLSPGTTCNRSSTRKSGACRRYIASPFSSVTWKVIPIALPPSTWTVPSPPCRGGWRGHERCCANGSSAAG